MATSPVSSGSSLDVASIVGQLMQVERQPLTRLQAREATALSRLTSFGRVQGAITALQAASQSLNDLSDFNGRAASVSGSGVAAAAVSTALPGQYAIKVSALAQAGVLSSAAVAATSTQVGTGTLTLQLGRYDSGANSFTAKSGAAAVAINIDSSNNTLAGVRDAINAANAGVTASIVNDGSGYRLTITSKDAGAVNGLRISVSGDGDGNDTNAAGLSQLAFDPTLAAGSGRNLTQTLAPQDASFTVNGLAMTATTNRVSEALPGVTLTLLKADNDAISNVTVIRDTNSVRTAISNFAKAYTDLRKVIGEVTRFDPSTRQAAALNGESSLRQLESLLVRTLSGSVTAASGDYQRLSEIGLRVNRDGTLNVDATTLDTALQDVDKVGRLLAGSNGAKGIAAQVSALADQLVGTAGIVTARTQGLQRQIDQFNKAEVSLNRKLSETQQRLTRQYSRLDAQLSSIQTQSNALGNALAGLSASRGQS